jgi:hypothetical protein
VLLEKPELFYKYCLVDYWKYKINALANAIMKYEKLKPELLEGVDDINDKDCTTAFKFDIHFTYFQIIECLFNMMFALMKKKIDNRMLWFYLSHFARIEMSRKAYKLIERIAEGETSFLDDQVVAGPDLQMPFVQYVFFFGGSFDVDEAAMKENLDKIKGALVLFAQDFIRREEYNAYKHSFRIFPAGPQKLEGINRSDGKILVTLTMLDSIASIKMEKDRSITQITKAFDWERDRRMALLCHALIFNLISTRRRFYFKDEKLFVNFFKDVDLRETSKMNSSLLDFKLNIRPPSPARKTSRTGRYLQRVKRMVNCFLNCTGWWSRR